ncbi:MULTISPECIES: HYC_CC_PP family protein [Flavobacteriaceae]|jgi:hypothetical protein|uniref:Secreted protein n=2 Tax=Flavobacteriaceae TaxID=49546 RepID=A0ABU5EJW1_9FLAO|nr:hypothetical protein [Winogradskyella aquimaris]MDY2585990.1 hypothetical protein [Winogradskyella aquimaris]
MKAIFFKIVSFCMALLVFVSTMSFTIESHYCGDVLVDTSVFGKVESCGMEVQQKTSSTECDITKKDCCSDEQLVVDGQDNLKISFDKLDKEQQILVATFIYSYVNLFTELQTENISFRDYSPPPLVRDVQVLDQTFLI